MESQGAPRLHLLGHPLLACDVSPGAAAGRSAAVGPPSVRQLCAWGRGRAWRCGRPVAVQKPGGSHGYRGSLPPTGGRGKGTGQMPAVTFGCALCGVWWPWAWRRLCVDRRCSQLAGWLAYPRAQVQTPPPPPPQPTFPDVKQQAQHTFHPHGPPPLPSSRSWLVLRAPDPGVWERVGEASRV